MNPRRTIPAVLAVLLLSSLTLAQQDVPFLESPDSVVEAMLELGQVSDEDVVFDLGSGDGRIVIAAARAGARGVGIEIEADLVELSRTNATEAGVAERVEFIEQDFFESDVSEATVLMMYLWPQVNRRLAPMLVEQLAPGTRVVSHRYKIQGWREERRIKVEGRPIYLYIVPDSPFR